MLIETKTCAHDMWLVDLFSNLKTLQQILNKLMS